MFRRAENCSWTTQKPGHSTIFRPVSFSTQRPRWRSGANTTGLSFGMLFTTRAALLLVQMMSLSAFTAAVVLM